MPEISKAIPIDQLPIFRNLKKETVSEMIGGAVAVTTKHRGLLFKAGDRATHLALVLQGAYKLVKTDPQGNESIVYFAGPGDPIGSLVMTRPDGAYPVSCIAIGSSLALKIPRETYLKSWATNATVQQYINSVLYQRMSRIQDEKMQQRLPLQSRVAFLLLNLLEKYSNGSDQILPIPITRQEIADSVGSTVESVIRLMSEWNSAGILHTEDRQIEVKSPDELIKISYCE